MHCYHFLDFVRSCNLLIYSGHHQRFFLGFVLSTKKEGCARKPALFWFTSEKQLLYAFPTKYLRRAGFAGGKWGGDEQTFKTDSIGQIHSLATSMQVFRLPQQELQFFLNRCLRALPLKFGNLVCVSVRPSVRDLQVTVFDLGLSNLACRTPSMVGRSILLDFGKKSFFTVLGHFLVFFGAFF